MTATETVKSLDVLEGLDFEPEWACEVNGHAAGRNGCAGPGELVATCRSCGHSLVICWGEFAWSHPTIPLKFHCVVNCGSVGDGADAVYRFEPIRGRNV